MYQGLYSIRQPTVIKPLMVGGKTFLVTADEGAIKSYNKANHGFEWTDATLGKNVGEFHVQTVDLYNGYMLMLNIMLHVSGSVTR